MIFKGTHILSGNGAAVVVATGLATEIGKIAQKISTIDTEIPLKPIFAISLALLSLQWLSSARH